MKQYDAILRLGLATEWIEIVLLMPMVMFILVSVLRPSGLKYNNHKRCCRSVGLGLATEWIEMLCRE